MYYIYICIYIYKMMMIDVLRLLCAHGRLNGLSNIQRLNEAKSKMKQPSDMAMPRFKHGGSDL